MRPPNKPRPDYPLTPCGNGQWRKVVNGKPYYFGSWRDDPRGELALREWLERKDAIYAGLDHITRQTAVSASGMTIAQIIQDYLKLRSAHVQEHKLSPATYRDYAINLNHFGTFFAGAKAAGLKPQHFAAYRADLEKRGLGPHTIRRIITCIRVAFNHAQENEWITLIHYGSGFAAPDTSSEAVALWHIRSGVKSTADTVASRRQVRRLLRAARAKPKWRAMILLMLNTGLNPAELARLQWSEINFKSGRLHRRRVKTGIVQECYLWKVTRKALLALPHEHETWIFVRKNGQPLVQQVPIEKNLDGKPAIARVSSLNRITRPFRDFAEAAGVPGITPYTLRRTARTVAAHWPDDNAAKRMMGQRLSGRDATYIKGRFPLARLHKISLTILHRLLAAPKKMRHKHKQNHNPTKDRKGKDQQPIKAA